ncbi:MAG: hypothetical protein AVDCRST_MAG38-1375 [uncultured Solirubrobacteraceae bacterium]|uniref:DUF4149 domain-containing protein n=1 Tax=uncultured Solirubrobacteraceae bacterium TaxID=1162706 RepID=A0A6J4RQ34_9ACTN|nr:MAG: hypothetical protein AVDCRST_MAG38-1375 [uncultured Solirubrobacteraceae bacterium]
MPDLLPPSIPASQIGRAASQVGMSGLLGGTLFGRLALHPAVTEISDSSERGKVINAAWSRYGAINSLSLLAVVGGWLGARADEARDANLSPRERRLARSKDVLVAACALNGLATMVEGIRFSKSAPEGAVPLADGDHVAPEATSAQARLKRRVDLLGRASLVTNLALVSVDAALSQENFRRPPARRMLSRLRR